MTHQFNISLEAASDGEAREKMTALVTLAKKLKSKELKKLADVVANDPVKTKLAKAYLGL